jgi:dienelactone hydrolase
MLPFVIRNHAGKSWPIVESFFKAVRENEGSDVPIGAAGFCWGGKHTVLLAHGSNTVNGKPLIDAAFTGHPSMLKFPDDVDKITIPTSFALAGQDMVVKAPNIEQIQKAIEKQPEEKKGEAIIYPGTGHGFCVRADHITKEKERAAAEAEDQAIAWFLKWFASVKY